MAERRTDDADSADISLAAREGIGAPVRRVEDRRFLTGSGRFVSDLAVANALHAVFVRSPHAHARIGAIDTSGAAGMPGVVAVFTGADMAADRVGPMRAMWAIKAPDGTPMANALLTVAHTLGLDDMKTFGDSTGAMPIAAEA